MFADPHRKTKKRGHPVVQASRCGRRSSTAFSHPDALVWTQSDRLQFWLDWLQRRWSHIHPAGQNPDSTKTKDPFFVSSSEEELLRWRGRTNKLFFWTRIFIGDFWESGQVSLQRKLFPETGTKTIIPKKIQTDDLSVALLLGFKFFFFFFFFLQQRCQRRARPKQTDDRECTNERRRDNARVYVTKMDTRSMYCQKNDKMTKKEKKNKGQRNYIYLLAHIMLQALLF